MVNVILWVMLALIWSSSFAAIKFGIDTIDPMMLVAGRMIIGATIMLAVLRFRGMALSKDWRTWAAYTFAGLMGNTIPFLLIAYGEKHVDSGLAAILMGISPVATVLMAGVFLPDEGLNSRSMIGVFIGVVGLVLLVGPEALSNIGKHVIGQFTILSAAICYSATTIFIKRNSTRSPVEMVAGSMLVGAICITLVVLFFGDPWHATAPSTSSVLAVIYLGIFPTALATLAYFFLVPRIGANRMSQVNFAVPISGALIGVVFLGETIDASVVVALGIIVIAIYLVTSKGRAGQLSPKR